MWRRKRADGRINTTGWMISYADMATILLAMFIVLSTLGKDQTGISLQQATGSLEKARTSFGLPGLFATTSQPIPMRGPTPHYAFTRSEEEPDAKPAGGRPERIFDGDEEHLRRFVQEIRRQFPCERQPRPAGQVIVDLYEPLAKQAPYLTDKHNEVLYQMLPLLEQSNYRLQLVVWAGTPAATAWTRATNQATLAAREFAAAAALSEAAAKRLLPCGQPWRYRDVRRPVLSLVLTKQE